MEFYHIKKAVRNKKGKQREQILSGQQFGGLSGVKVSMSSCMINQKGIRVQFCFTSLWHLNIYEAEKNRMIQNTSVYTYSITKVI
jgi:hypothetical protein